MKIKSLLIVPCLSFAAQTVAEPIEVTNTFENGEVADATQINENFANITSGTNERVNVDLLPPFNTGIGSRTLFKNTTGNFNVAAGFLSLYENTEGSYNAAFGEEALHFNTTGDNNTAVGASALYTNGTGINNSAVGFEASYLNSAGIGNTVAGFRSLYSNINGSANTAMGLEALKNNTATGNTAVGFQSLFSNTGGEENTAVGYQALFLAESDGITFADSNTAVGFKALRQNSTGDRNTALGANAMELNGKGSFNTAIGYAALSAAGDGSDNTAVGTFAMEENKGDFNSALGRAALSDNTTGTGNTAIGRSAILFNTSGSSNTAVGEQALRDNVTGDGNTALGRFADVSTDGLTNAMALGYNAKVGKSNAIRLGNTEIELIEAQVGLTITSDARLKHSIEPIAEALPLINALNPVSYQRVNTTSGAVEMGLLAQELMTVLRTHGLAESGMVTTGEGNQVMSVRYNDLIAPMIRAIQELDERYQNVVALLHEQEKSLAALRSERSAQAHSTAAHRPSVEADPRQVAAALR